MSGSGPLQQAQACIARGEFERARQFAEQSVAATPRDPEALRALGIAEFRLGRLQEATGSLRRSLKCDASAAATHHALGNVFQEEGRLELAIASYHRALRLDPDLAQVHNDLGTALYASGRMDEAIQAFRTSLALDPSQAMGYENLGTALRRAGRFAEAKRAFGRSLVLRLAAPFRRLLGRKPRRASPTEKPLSRAVRLAAEGRRDEALLLCDEMLAAESEHAEALHMKGVLLMDRDGPQAALPLIERAIRAQGRIAEFHNSLGVCLRRLERHAEAMAAYNRALELLPGFGLAMVNIAELSADLENFPQAERAARAALAADAGLRRARLPLARALYGLGRFEEMEVVAREATALEPERPEPRMLLGMGLREIGRLDEAQASFEKSIELAPQDPMAHKTMGAFFLDCRRDAARALKHYRQARRLEGPQGPASFSEALARLATGDYSRGTWDLYELRRTQGHRAAAYTKIGLPEWDGEPAPGRKLIVYAEQGLGDEIMFASMVPEAAQRVGRCVLAGDPRLQPLFARSFPSVECVGWLRERYAAGAPELRGAEIAVPIASLGRLFRAGREHFPPQGAYLRADPAKVAAFRERLSRLGPPPYYGIAWQGGMWTSGRSRRSMRLGELAGPLAAHDARWVSLQFDAAEADVRREQGPLQVAHWHDALASVDDSAALIAALDGVLAVCSWVVHVAGALGKPVLVLAPFAPEWRYGHAGEGMVWYPSARVLRQERFGDWASVLEHVNAVLQGRASWSPMRTD
jgi:tetratricopeptide (TPR) repeat protein